MVYLGTREQLLSIISVARDSNAQVVSSAFASTQRALSSQAGPATTHTGNADSQVLVESLLRQASAEYRFKNYYALERAANVGSAYVLTEEYRSLPD